MILSRPRAFTLWIIQEEFYRIFITLCMYSRLESIQSIQQFQFSFTFSINSRFSCLPKIFWCHAGDGRLIVLIPHESFGRQVSFGCYPHLLLRASDVLFDQICLVPVVLVPTCGRRMKEKIRVSKSTSYTKRANKLFWSLHSATKLKKRRRFVDFEVENSWRVETKMFEVDSNSHRCWQIEIFCIIERRKQGVVDNLKSSKVVLRKSREEKLNPQQAENELKRSQTCLVHVEEFGKFPPLLLFLKDET